ncbi:MAG: hypothetical protein GWO24_36650 [Akkermansiaceae bacterium]|nr:hypothetical protein [Akkermansiaceae bacterium]
MTTDAVSVQERHDGRLELAAQLVAVSLAADGKRQGHQPTEKRKNGRLVQAGILMGRTS